MSQLLECIMAIKLDEKPRQPDNVTHDKPTAEQLNEVRGLTGPDTHLRAEGLLPDATLAIFVMMIEKLRWNRDQGLLRFHCLREPRLFSLEYPRQGE